MDWQPIATAPRDGTWVWLRAPWPYDGLQWQTHMGSFGQHSDGDPPEWRMHSKDIGWCRQNRPTEWAESVESWRPIASAPTDGTTIIAASESKFMPRFPYPLPSKFIDGVWRCNMGDRWSPYDPQPTHWKPAPTPQDPSP